MKVLRGRGEGRSGKRLSRTVGSSLLLFESGQQRQKANKSKYDLWKTQRKSEELTKHVHPFLFGRKVSERSVMLSVTSRMSPSLRIVNGNSDHV